MMELVAHDPNHPNHVTDPCRWVYASGNDCELPASAHGQGGRGPQHLWSAVPRSNDRCVQCGSVIRWGHYWGPGVASCSDCFYSDFG